jgi:hypothetical protein
MTDLLLIDGSRTASDAWSKASTDLKSQATWSLFGIKEGELIREVHLLTVTAIAETEVLVEDFDDAGHAARALEWSFATESFWVWQTTEVKGGR